MTLRPKESQVALELSAQLSPAIASRGLEVAQIWSKVLTAVEAAPWGLSGYQLAREFVGVKGPEVEQVLTQSASDWQEMTEKQRMFTCSIARCVGSRQLVEKVHGSLLCDQNVSVSLVDQSMDYLSSVGEMPDFATLLETPSVRGNSKVTAMVVRQALRTGAMSAKSALCYRTIAPAGVVDNRVMLDYAMAEKLSLDDAFELLCRGSLSVRASVLGKKAVELLRDCSVGEGWACSFIEQTNLQSEGIDYRLWDSVRDNSALRRAVFKQAFLAVAQVRVFPRLVSLLTAADLPWLVPFVEKEPTESVVWRVYRLAQQSNDTALVKLLETKYTQSINQLNQREQKLKEELDALVQPPPIESTAVSMYDFVTRKIQSDLQSLGLVHVVGMARSEEWWRPAQLVGQYDDLPVSVRQQLLGKLCDALSKAEPPGFVSARRISSASMFEASAFELAGC